MPNIPEFDTSAEVTGATLISQTDEEIRQLMTDVKSYQESVSAILNNYTTEEIDSAIANLNADITLKLNELLSVNPDGTYYTKNAIDSKFEEVQTESSKNISANFPFSGYIQKKPKEDGLYFEESINFIASIGDKGQFLNFNGILVDTYGSELIINRDFSDGLTGWDNPSNVWSAVDNKAFTSTTTYSALHQNDILKVGKTYKASVNVEVISGTLRWKTILSNGTSPDIDIIGQDITESGYYENTFTTPLDTLRLSAGFYRAGEFTGYIDNASIKEVQTLQLEDMIPKTQIVSGASPVTVSPIASGDYAIYDRTGQSSGVEVYRAIEDIPVSTPLTDSRFQTTEQSPPNYINNRKHSQVTNQIIITEVYNTVTDTFLGLQGEVSFNDVSAEDSVKQIMTLNDFTLEGTCYRKGDNLHILVSVIKMDNLGLYHYSLNGLGHAKASDDKFFNDTTVSFTSVADCFDPTKLLANSGKISSGKSGSPRGRYADIIYSNNAPDYRLSGEKANLPEILVDGNNAMISNSELGGKGVMDVMGITSLISGSSIADGDGGGYFSASGYVNVYCSGEAQQEEVYPIGSFVQIIDKTAGTVGGGYVDEYINDSQYRVRISNPIGNLSNTNITYVYDGYVMATKQLPILSQNTSLVSEILSEPSRYPTILTDRLSEGKECLLIANLFDDNGNSNVPDGVKTTFKLNKKALDQLQALKTSDLGVTWTIESVVFDNTENTITFSSAPSVNDMILVQNTALNTPSFQSDLLPIEWLGNKSIASNQVGSNISYSQGYVSTSDKLENRNLEDNLLDENSNIQGLPTHNTHTLSTASNGVKMLSSLAKKDGELVYQMFTEEAKSSVSNWDRGNYDELTNGTTDDNNTTKVRTSVQIFRTGEQV